MSLCKNCIHQRACVAQFRCDNCHENFSEPEISCDQYKNANAFVELPYAIGQLVYTLWNPISMKEDAIYSFHIDAIEWDGYTIDLLDDECRHFESSEIFTRREDAEKELEERRKYVLR